MKKVVMLLSNPLIKDPRVEFEADALSRNGYNVEVVAWDRLGEIKSEEKRKNFFITRIYVKSGYNKGIKQTFYFFLFYIKALKHILKLNDIEIIHCHDFDTFFCGCIVKFFKKSKLVYDAHEIYPDMIRAKAVFKKVIISAEKMFLRYSDLFITVGRIRKKYYKENNYPAVPVVIGNWKEKKAASDGKEERLKGKIVILYIGVLNKERMLSDFIEAVKNDERFYFIIAGAGAEKDRILSMISGVKNIKYLGFLKDENMINHYNSASDIIYYGIDKNHPVSKTAVPNKMFEAIAYDKIFYCAETGEMKSFKNHFIFIKNYKTDLDKLYKIVKDKNKRKKISILNKKMYGLYNAGKARSLLLESYSKL